MSDQNAIVATMSTTISTAITISTFLATLTSSRPGRRRIPAAASSLLQWAWSVAGALSVANVLLGAGHRLLGLSPLGTLVDVQTGEALLPERKRFPCLIQRRGCARLGDQSIVLVEGAEAWGSRRWIAAVTDGHQRHSTLADRGHRPSHAPTRT